jgi:hypothetical protein
MSERLEIAWEIVKMLLAFAFWVYLIIGICVGAWYVQLHYYRYVWRFINS